jgi:hypothetical protein
MRLTNASLGDRVKAQRVDPSARSSDAMCCASHR